MAIKFLVNHSVEGPPEEHFKKGQVVTNRSPASEMHFVRRGVAGFWDAKRKVMTDHEDEVIETKPKAASSTPSITVYDVSARRRLV